MRMVILGAMILTLASAFLLYGINYDTRQLEARVSEQERAIEEARDDIAVLKAERAHLGRPERIEPLARAHGLRPATEQQLAASPDDALARALGARTAQLRRRRGTELEARPAERGDGRRRAGRRSCSNRAPPTARCAR